MFGETNDRKMEKYNGEEIEVIWLPKYKESRAKAIEILQAGKHGVSEADFWILKNKTKSGKLGYSGLIISHNGCLKINDTLDDKFRAECVTVDPAGWGGSLVCFYKCQEQGLFEVGEVSKTNCKNDYPYAMAVKRLFDRVVLKLSKLAYAGIYGEDEADDFKAPQEVPDIKPFDADKAFDKEFDKGLEPPKKKSRGDIVKEIIAKKDIPEENVKYYAQDLFGTPLRVKEMTNEQFDQLCEELNRR